MAEARDSKASRFTLAACVLALSACAQPPTEVVDMTNVPELTRDAMVQVRVLPLAACRTRDFRSITTAVRLRRLGHQTAGGAPITS